MPGHKGSEFFQLVGADVLNGSLADLDITEINGADNKFMAETIIRETMDKYKELYGAKESFLLVNGSSGGIIAAILASTKKGDSIAIARNCHKSVYNALQLGDLKPVYFKPEKVDEYPIAGHVEPSTVAQTLEANPDVKVVVLSSPNYYGICSDISAIAEEVHKRGGILIVDQAHGAHLKFFDETKLNPDHRLAAENLGADIVINSTHKTMASFTESGVMNLCSDRVDVSRLAAKLHLIETTSPSYILMASLDVNADVMRDAGPTLIAAWQKNIDYFYNESIWIRGLLTMDNQMMDRTKIILDMSYLGLDGKGLGEELERRNIFPELTDGNLVLCMTGIGNKKADYDALLGALHEISAERIDGAMKRAEEEEAIRSEFDSKRDKLAAAVMNASNKEDLDAIESALIKLAEEEAALSGKEEEVELFDVSCQMAEIPDEWEEVPMKSADGRVAAQSLTPYPPGIPLVAAGEVLNQKVIEILSKFIADGKKITGVTLLEGEPYISVGK